MGGTAMLDAYLLLADHDNDISSDPAMQDRFRALLVMSTIFNRRTILSDAQLLNSRNFRYLLQSDRTIRELVTRGAFGFRVRKNNVIEVGSSETRLHAVQAVFLKRDPFNKMVHAPRDIYLRRDDLQFLYEENYKLKESEKFIGEWDVWDARSSFTNRMTVVFASEKASYVLGDRLKDQIIRELDIEKRNDNGLGRAFMDDKLVPKLSLSNFDLLPDQIAFIRESVAGHFLVNLSDMFSLPSLYGESQRSAIQSARRRESADFQLEGEQKFRPYLSRQLFVYALNTLSVEQIVGIRDSPFVNEFHKRSAEIRAYTDAPPSSAFDNLRKAVIMVAEELEDALVAANPHVKSSITELPHISVQTKISRLATGMTVSMDAFSVAGGSIAASGVIQDLVFRLLGKRVAEKAALDEREKRAEEILDRENLQQSLVDSGNTEKIKYLEGLYVHSSLPEAIAT